MVVGADPKEGKGRGVLAVPHTKPENSVSDQHCPYPGLGSYVQIAFISDPTSISISPASSSIMKILKSHADKFELGGIDEAYLDISSQVKDFDEAREFAKSLMSEVLEKESLTCSISFAPNKMVAKIASDFKKPHGLTVVKEEEVKDFLFPPTVRKIPGVGPKKERALKELNIGTISDLASAKPGVLTRLFGVYGARLHEFANGIDNSEVVEEYETKSIGRDTTFEKDVDNEEQILQVLDGLAEEVHEDVIANGFKFKTITVRVRYEHFDTYTRSKSLLFSTNDLDILKNNAKRLIVPFLRGNRKVRLIGLRVSNLNASSMYIPSANMSL